VRLWAASLVFDHKQPMGAVEEMRLDALKDWLDAYNALTKQRKNS